jgi:hypothetical protein
MRPLRPVALERRPAVVKLPALELDNDVGTGPGHVDLIAGNPGVDLRRREPLVVAKTHEPRLQPGLRLGDAGRIEAEELAEDRHPRRPAFLSTCSVSDAGVTTPRRKPSSKACSRCLGATTAARSSRVRAGLVTGIRQ